jgi:hypothetical protein
VSKAVVLKPEWIQRAEAKYQASMEVRDRFLKELEQEGKSAEVIDKTRRKWDRQSRQESLEVYVQKVLRLMEEKGRAPAAIRSPQFLENLVEFILWTWPLGHPPKYLADRYWQWELRGNPYL